MSAPTGFLKLDPSRMLPTGHQRLKALAPGVLISITVAMAAMFLADHYGAPVMLFALLLGMAFHFLSEDAGKCTEGVNFSARTLLRVGVALLGARITVDQIMELGLTPIGLVVSGVLLTIFVGVALSRMMGLSNRFGFLTGGSVAICGASAALAITSVLPGNKERDTIFTVIAVTTLSTVAMVLYPILASMIGLDLQTAGIFLGATIHDVAQVVGAGYSMSEGTGDIATYTKLLRVAMLVPVIVGLTVFLAFRGGAKSGAKGFLPPFFLVAFVGIVAVNSLGLLPQLLLEAMVEVSRWCLVIAIAALGIKTSLKAVTEVGVKPLALVVLQTVFIAGYSLAVIYICYGF